MSLNKRIPAASGSFAGPYAAIFEFTGGGTSDVTVSGMSFEPDFIKFRKKSEASYEYYTHKLEANTWWHTSQGGNSSGTNVSNGSNQVIEWNSDGFTIKGNSSTSGSINQSGKDYIGLALYAGNESVTNNDGNVTSTVMASPDAGFSIVQFTSGGSSTTFGHGLGVAPEISVSTYGNHSDNPNCHYYDDVLHNEMRRGQGWLNAHSDTDLWAIGGYNTDTISVGPQQVSGGSSGTTYTWYCFAEKPHQQMGMWLGNFSTSTREVYGMTDSADPKYVRVMFIGYNESPDIYQPLYDSVSGGLYRFDDVLQFSSSSSEYNLNFGAFGEYIRLDWTDNRLLTNSDWYPINGRADLNYHYYGIFWGGDNCEIL